MGYESENETGIIPRFSKDLFKEIENLGNQHNVCIYKLFWNNKWIFILLFLAVTNIFKTAYVHTGGE